MSADVRRLVLLRHGETEWSVSGRHTGTTDIPLTERGIGQAHALARLFADLHLRDPLVISSPRIRAVDTAMLAGLRVARTWDALSEWDYGDYEGITTPTIRETVPGWTVWTHPCPGGESSDAVAARADEVLSVAAASLPYRDVVLVGHGHFSRALLARWVGLPVSGGARFAMPASSVAVLGFERDVRQVCALGATPPVADGR